MNEQQLKTKIGNEPITMYRLANILSEVVGRRVREQMMYTYRRNGMIRVNHAGRCEPDVAYAFVVKYATKRGVKIS